MKILENYSNADSNYNDKQGNVSHLNTNNNDLRGKTFIHNGITVHIGYKDTEKTLVDNLNQYFSQLY